MVIREENQRRVVLLSSVDDISAAVSLLTYSQKYDVGLQGVGKFREHFQGQVMVKFEFLNGGNGHSKGLKAFLLTVCLIIPIVNAFSSTLFHNTRG